VSRKGGTGPSEDYTPVDEEGVLDAFDEALDAYYGDPSDWVDDWYDEDDEDEEEGEGRPASRQPPTEAHFVAEVEWAGTFNPQAHRALRADQLDLTDVIAAVAATRSLVRGVAQRLRSYDEVTLRGRIHRLERTQVGRDHLAAEGITRRLIRDWESGRNRPSQAKREAVDRAFEAAATRYVTRERTRFEGAAHRVAEALSAALRDRYGAEIRVRNISSLELY